MTGVTNHYVTRINTHKMYYTAYTTSITLDNENELNLFEMHNIIV